MKSSSIFYTFVIFLGWSLPASADRYCVELFKTERVGEIAKINRPLIEDSLKEYYSYNIALSVFSVHRDLRYYLLDFQSGKTSGNGNIPQFSLAHSLIKLHHDSHVLDLGAGLLLFVDQYGNNPIGKLQWVRELCGVRCFGPIISELLEHIKMQGGPNLTGITMTDLDNTFGTWGEQARPLKLIRENGKVNALTGRYFEDIPVQDITGKFGKVDLAVDNYGIFAYTMNLGITTEKVATVMKTGSELWLVKDYCMVALSNRTLVPISDFLVLTGLFEPVNFSVGGQAPKQPKLLRRTARPAHSISTDLLDFVRRENGEPYRVFRYFP
jgi:hypothetical protein